MLNKTIFMLAALLLTTLHSVTLSAQMLDELERQRAELDRQIDAEKNSQQEKDYAVLLKDVFGGSEPQLQLMLSPRWQINWV
jgi:hypothetical protein